MHDWVAQKTKHHPPFDTFQLSDKEEPHLDKHPTPRRIPSGPLYFPATLTNPLVPSLLRTSYQRTGLILCKAILDPLYRKKPFILYSWFKKRKLMALFFIFVFYLKDIQRHTWHTRVIKRTLLCNVKATKEKKHLLALRETKKNPTLFDCYNV